MRRIKPLIFVIRAGWLGRGDGLRHGCRLACGMDADEGRHWILLQFSVVAGRPWFALQQHSDAGVERQYTGYRHEIDGLVARLAIKPEELEPMEEEAFFSRFAGQDVSP